MKDKLKVIGYFMGDKPLDGDVLNLKFGGVRYYPQDNPNILRDTVREISPKTLIRILSTLFYGCIVDVDKENNLVNHIRYGDKTVIYIINKAYICIKEATSEYDGTIVYLHNGYVLIYKEKHK